APQPGEAELLLRSRRHRRLRPGRLVLEVLDLAPSSEHQLKAPIGLADVVEPCGEGDVFGEPRPETAASCVLAREDLDVGAMYRERDRASRAEGVVSIRGEFHAVLKRVLGLKCAPKVGD